MTKRASDPPLESAAAPANPAGAPDDTGETFPTVLNHVDKRLVTKSLHFCPGSRVAYMNNPKCACSSIKASLWRYCAERNNRDPSFTRVHDRDKSPFLHRFDNNPANLEQLRTAHFFTVVRNPYARILSAYLDKIGLDRLVWRPFYRQYFLNPQYPKKRFFSFRDFLTVLRHAYPPDMNPHFRPQYINVAANYVDFSFVGRLEQMEDTARFLDDNGLTLETRQRHSRKAASRVEEFYGDEEVDLARELFAEDFRLFGYSPDPQSGETGPMQLKHGDNALIDFLTNGHANVPHTTDNAVMAAWEAEDDDEKRLSLVEQHFEEISDMRLLRSFATHALLHDALGLHQAIIRRTLAVRTRHFPHLQNRDMILPAMRELYERHFGPLA